MSDKISYTIRAHAVPETAMVRVRIKCRIRNNSHRWRLEMPRLLWTSMGTEEAAAFVTEQYFEAYPAEREFNVEDHIAQAIATSLYDANTYFSDPAYD